MKWKHKIFFSMIFENIIVKGNYANSDFYSIVSCEMVYIIFFVFWEAYRFPPFIRLMIIMNYRTAAK